MRHHRIWTWGALALALLVLVACAGSGGGDTIASPPPIKAVPVLSDASGELLSDEEHQDMSAELAAADDPDGSPEIRQARFEWFWRQRAYPLNTVPFMANNRALAQARAMRATAQVNPWQSIGPAPLQEEYQNDDPNTGQPVRTTASGRLIGIAFDPNSPNTIYVATAGGGVWKSTDKGATFTSITSSRPEFAFNSVAVDPQNSNIVYAGTGDLNGYYGNGILKSTDGGQTWTLLGSSKFGSNAVTQILIDPTNTSRIYASTAWSAQRPTKNQPPYKGVFRSTDGGQTWQEVLACNPCSTGFTDLLMDPSNPQILYAGNAGVGIFKSTDGGDTWNKLDDFSQKVGRQNYQRLEMAIGAGTGSSTLLAGIDGARNVGGNVVAWGYVFKSTDGGQNWTRLDPNSTPNYCGSQCWYDNVIAINPGNPNEMYLGGVDIYRSTDGGASWTNIRQGVHVDQHAAAFDPADPGVLWMGNDGGLFRYKNGAWESFNNGITSLQFTGLGVHPTNQNLAVGGMQDNSHAIYDGTNWKGFSFADGNKAEFDPFDPTIIYHGDQQISFFANKGSTAAEMRQNAESRVSGINPNDRALFYIPYETDPNTASVLYLGTDKVYRTTDRGKNWTAISQVLDPGGSVSAIGVPRNNANLIFAGTNRGQIHKATRDQSGQWNWTNLTAAPLPNRHLSDIAIHPTNSQIVYLAFNGFTTNTPSSPGHIFKSTDGGQTWTRVDGSGTSTFPDVPALTILIDPDNTDHIYVGTDIGVFQSTDGGGSWTTFSQGLPPVPVTDLKYQQANKLLWASTYGRSIYRTSLASSSPTPTSTPTAGPTTPPTATPMPTITPTPTDTPVPPSTGPAPGQWTGDVSFLVASDQTRLFNFQVKVNFGRCTETLQFVGPATIDQNGNFSFTVKKRDSTWSATGTLSNKTGSGTVTLQNVAPSTSMCGSPVTTTINWNANWTASAPDPTATPVPPTPTATPTPSSTSGIHGQVRNKGVGIESIQLGLYSCASGGSDNCNPEAQTPVTTTTTMAGGFYDFTGVPALPAGQEYFVFYLNDESAGNTVDDTLVYRWYSQSITSYTGGSASGGDFDIGELFLVEPSDGITATLPITFTWQARTAVTGENYVWTLFDPETGETVCESAPDASTSFVLDETFFASKCVGVLPGVEYGWFVWAVEGTSFDTATGYGDSFYVGVLSFEKGNVRTYLPTVRK